jgi:16S rRNA (cytidine1402-2'-O)-methyltransferase
MGTLYLIATPIGNLEDISARALRLLRDVKLVAAEDTRVTRNLFRHFDIHTPLTSYFEHNKLTKLDSILAALDLGDVALVSDAGTPGLNDPGYELVHAALIAEHRVSPVPGPASPIAALVASGLPADSFLYLGYLPRKSSERRKFLERVVDLPYTLIFLETPHRLIDSLEDLAATLGERQVAIARELTKLHEEIWRGMLSQAQVYFKEPRGEFVLVVSGQRSDVSKEWSEEKLLARIKKEIASGKSSKDISFELAEQSGWKKRDVYRLIANEDKEKSHG